MQFRGSFHQQYPSYHQRPSYYYHPLTCLTLPPFLPSLLISLWINSSMHIYVIYHQLLLISPLDLRFKAQQPTYLALWPILLFPTVLMIPLQKSTTLPTFLSSNHINPLLSLSSPLRYAFSDQPLLLQQRTSSTPGGPYPLHAWVLTLHLLHQSPFLSPT